MKIDVFPMKLQALIIPISKGVHFRNLLTAGISTSTIENEATISIVAQKVIN